MSEGRAPRISRPPAGSRRSTGFVSLTSDLGVLRFELYRSLAPRLVDRFVNLVRDQRDEESSVGFTHVSGQERILGCRFSARTDEVFSPVDDEFDFDLVHNRPYLLSFSNTGKTSRRTGTNSDSFFVSLAPLPSFDFHFPVIGEVADDRSRRIIDVIAGLPTDATGLLLNPILLSPDEAV